MANTIRGATWRLALSFAAVSIVSGFVMWTAKGGMFSAASVDRDAAFGGGQTDDAVTVYITEGRLCESMFTEPFETCLVLTNDLGILTFSTREAGRVGISAPQIVEKIKQSGYEIAQVVAVVHNHFTPAGFTMADRATYNYLKARGFTGIYAIWYTTTKRFIPIQEK